MPDQITREAIKTHDEIMRLCSIEGCENTHCARGYCQKHWTRFNKYGDPNYTKYKMPEKQRVDKRSSLYRVYTSMKQRCYNPNKADYMHYGGRGITISDDWLEGFDNFYRDMYPRPAGMSIERIDNNKGYSKENCRWATHKEQMNNTRLTVIYRGHTRQHWAEKFGVKQDSYSIYASKNGDERAYNYYKSKHLTNTKKEPEGQKS